MTMTPANIEILSRYLASRSYGLLDFAVLIRDPRRVAATFTQAEKWWAHEQAKQRNFNEDAKRVIAAG